MMVEQKGNTVDEAIEMALKKLGVPREKVKIEVISEGKKGVFGLGAQMVVVRVTTIEDVESSSVNEERPARGAAKVSATESNPEAVGVEEKSPGTEFLREVFKVLGMKADFQTSVLEDGMYGINIITSDGALLIGKQGKNLDALQYLTNIIMNKDASKRTKVVLDTEGYRGRRKEALAALAKKIADEVRQTGKSVSLEPMSAYERRIIHIVLQEDPDITTESTGDGEERRVVIKMRKRD